MNFDKCEEISGHSVPGNALVYVSEDEVAQAYKKYIYMKFFR
ncbi:hypothetical protein [Clostridium saccharobutylicum]|nr:hypothetical protein [Clostridium saccharobutylicum]